MSAKIVKGAIYPPAGKEVKDLTNEEVANLTAIAGYRDYDWSCSKKKTTEEKIKSTAETYAKMFSRGYHPENQIAVVCHTAQQLYYNGIHESLVIEWVKRIGCINIEQKDSTSLFYEGKKCWWATSPISNQASIFISCCASDGISTNFKNNRYLHNASSSETEEEEEEE